MKAKNCTWQNVLDAVNKINTEIFENNIQINPDNNGLQRFTLRPVSSSAKGASYKRGRRINACCWHVHGEFFDALFEIAPEAVITSAGRKITKDDGNWEDYNVGSLLQPLMASEACKCEE